MKFLCALCFFLLLFSYRVSADSQSHSLLSKNSLSLKGVLGAHTSQQEGDFARALEPIKFQFPRDHLSHPAFKTEWWYISGNISTGNLKTANVTEADALQEKNRAFAYQFTLFRFALHPEKRAIENSSAWRSRHIYMAHISLTDINKEKFYQQERFSRDGLGLAGADDTESSLQKNAEGSLHYNAEGSIQFWLNDWQAKSIAADRLFPLKLNIRDPQFTLNLQLESSKPLVLQGEQGLSQKSSEHASYYYSYTRLFSQGTITIGDEVFRVSGNSWFDREWSTSSLGEDQQGWDWFALHLDDGSDLMLYQMRKNDGTKDRYSSGTFVDQQGGSQTLSSRQFQLQALEFWQSPASGIRYPIKWQVLIPEQSINLIVSTKVRHQEWSKAEGFSFNYWEGAVEVSGEKDQKPISGSGYLEMTGYR